jgi:Leucine-rich repeat (LRR) protein
MLTAPIMRLPNLQELNLYNNSIDDEDVVGLMVALRSASQLTELNLGFNNISHQGAQELSNSILQGGLGSLITLSLGSNDLHDAGAKALAPALGLLASLERLMLDHNGIGHEGMQALAPQLANLRGLSELHLQKNPLGDVGAEHVARVLRATTALCYIDFFSEHLHVFGGRVVLLDSTEI